MTFDPDAFRAISADDMTMPGGWSVSAGQTFLYTKAEQEIVQQARAFAQRGIGYTTDFPIQAIFRNARLLRIGAGSDEIMKFLIARELLREIKR